MSGHTPGPWTARLGEYDFGSGGERRVMFGPQGEDGSGRICEVDARTERITRGKNATAYNAPDAERDANARLIAAAPDLLAACERIAEIARSGQPITHERRNAILDAATEAIRIATETNQ